MKKLILLAAVACFAAVTTAQAQKVYKDAQNRVVLDMTIEAGMPAGAQTSTPKTWTGTPSNVAHLANNGAQATINATVYHKLEVAPHDINTATQIVPSGGTRTMNWAVAFSACRNSTHGGGGWRLPTQREMQMLFIFRPALEDTFADPSINGTNFEIANYWTATEEDGTDRAWYTTFERIRNNVPSSNYSKGNPGYYVRCVREMP